MDLAYWRDIALVVLAIEGLIFGLLPLILFVFAIRGVRWLDRQVRTYSAQARDGWRDVHKRVDKTARTIRSPLERVEHVSALLKSLIPIPEDER